MKLGIQGKLTVIYFVIVLFIGVVFYAYLSHSLRNYLEKQITTNLTRQAILLRDYWEATLWVGKSGFPKERATFPEPLSYDKIDSLTDKFGAELKARVTFIAPDGNVWGDSEVDGDALVNLENHKTSDRTEILSAYSGKVGIRERYSATLGTQMLYVAVPVKKEGRLLGVVRLSLALEDVKAAIAKTRRIVIISGLLACALSLFLIFGISKAVTRPLRRLASTAEKLSQGDFDARAELNSNDEVGYLGHTLNRMAKRLQRQIHQLSEERDRLEMIFSNMVEGIILLDEQFNIKFANSAIKDIFQIKGEITGQSLLETIRNPDINKTLQRTSQDRQVVLEELAAFTPIQKTLNVCIVPIINQDTPLEQAPRSGIPRRGTGEFVLVVHDVSQLRKLEQMRAEFVANVTHELRTPLTSIQGYAETLLDGALGDEENARQFVLTIQRQAQRLSALISDLLELSRIESGQVTLNLAPQNLNELVKRILDIFEPAFSEKGLKFTSEISEDLPEVSADEHLLTQVLINLLDNAIKYTEEGAQITVSAKMLASEIQVDVRDTGIGIKESDIDRIFERFYRVDKSRSRELGGSGLRSKVLRSTGLGLSIVKHIIQQHGGRIWVESQLGQGSTFSFVLPKA